MRGRWRLRGRVDFGIPAEVALGKTFGMNAALRRPMSQEDFLVWVEAQEGRYEFDGFQPVAMVDGSNRHGMIGCNLIAEIVMRFRGKACRAISAEGGGVATVGKTVRFPDVTVTCSEIRVSDLYEGVTW